MTGVKNHRSERRQPLNLGPRGIVGGSILKTRSRYFLKVRLRVAPPHFYRSLPRVRSLPLPSNPDREGLKDHRSGRRRSPRPYGHRSDAGIGNQRLMRRVRMPKPGAFMGPVTGASSASPRSLRKMRPRSKASPESLSSSGRSEAFRSRRIQALPSADGLRDVATNEPAG